MEIRYQVSGISLDIGIHLDSSLMSSYSSQITLYRSLHAYQQSILESTTLSIMTGAGASCVLLEKELDVAGSSMDIWNTG